MAAIAEQAERDKMRENDIIVPLSDKCDQREFLAHSAIEATQKINVAGIITDSETGLTARILASFRGSNPVLAICYKEKTQQKEKGLVSAQYVFYAALRMLRQKGYISLDDKIAYLSGSFGEGGGTTFLEINNVKDVFDKKYKFHLPNFE